MLRDPSRVILLAPLVFAAHVAEEAPYFVAYFNDLVDPDITQPLFVSVNVGGMAIMLVAAAVAAMVRDRASLLIAFGWLAFVFFANAIFHIAATLALNRYSPGVATASLLYVPYFAWFAWALVRRYDIGVARLAAIAIAAGLPMYAHGYLIIFEGRRLV